MSEPVLVTGIAGFIGSAVARRLIAEGIPVVGVDDLSQGKLANVPPEARFIRADLADPATVRQLPDTIGAILHLAGQSSGEISFDDPVADLQKNVVSTLHLAQWAMAHGVRRLVYASSMSVYGQHANRPVAETDSCKPLSCYGVGKLAAERYLRIYASRLSSVSLRMFNVYGPGQDMDNMRQGMVSIFLKMALTDSRVQVKGSLDRYRDFIYIDDAVEWWVRAMRLQGADSYALNVGTGRRTTVQALLTQMKQFIPDLEWFSEGSTPGDQFGIYADTTRLHQLLGAREATDLSSGLSQFTAWAKAHCQSLQSSPAGKVR